MLPEYRNCLNCGKRFYVEPENRDLPDSDYCSWKCEDQYDEGREETMTDERLKEIEDDLEDMTIFVEDVRY